MIDDVAEARVLATADAEIESGNGVPHGRARAWLLKLAKSEVWPAPTARS